MKNHTLLIVAALVGLLSAGCSKHASRPNQAIYEYLGNPVAPPAGLDAAYTKAGLTNAMQDAAQAANISLKKIEIDDSEFPFLVGVVWANNNDYDKLEGQLRKAGYQESGFIRGDPVCVMNITPRASFLTDARSQIQNRLDLRERIFFEKIRSNP
jgi:hypothetical protein